MSLRLLQKQVGSSASAPSAEAKAATQAQGRGHAGGGQHRGDRERGGYGGGHGGGGSGSYYSGGGGSGGRDRWGGEEGGGAGNQGGSSSRVAAPAAPTRFHGSDAQRAHIEAMRRATAEAGPAAAAAAPAPGSEVAVKSSIGLEAVKEKKRQEEEDRRAKREAARAKRQDKVLDKEKEDEQALGECEEQAQRDCEEHERLKYEAALVVRIAVKFGTSDVWMKISEARTRGADIPLDTRKVYLLAHPDRNPLPEATDATAILNAQRPPEMTEVKAKPPTAAAAASPPAAPAAPPPAAAQAAGADAGAADAGAAAVDAEAEDAERRVDPEDNQTCTLKELQNKYEGTYSAAEIEEYWRDECRPPPKPKPVSRRY